MDAFSFKLKYFLSLALSGFTLIIVLAGCSSKRPLSIKIPEGAPIRIFSGYVKDSVDSQVYGDEFVFSTIMPKGKGGPWHYSLKSNEYGFLPYHYKSGGMITSPASPSSVGNVFNHLVIMWEWVHLGDISLLFAGDEDARNISFYRPWFQGVAGQVGKRIMYAPAQSEIDSGKWYEKNYVQFFFHDIISIADNGLYCVRSVSSTDSVLQWSEQQGVYPVSDLPRYAQFHVDYTCPLRTIDGRDARFMIKFNFLIRGNLLTKDFEPLDYQLNEFHEWLEPTWQSLELMPQAYQFDPPEGAQQSVFCASHGFCWQDIKENP